MLDSFPKPTSCEPLRRLYFKGNNTYTSQLADIFSTISVLSHALSAGYPVPASLPRLRDRLIYHDRHMFAHGQSSFLSPQKYSEKKGLLDDGYSSTTGLDPSANKVDGVTIGFEELTLDVLMVCDKQDTLRSSLTHFNFAG